MSIHRIRENEVLRILHVDDDEDVLTFTKIYLEDEIPNSIILSVKSPKEALDRLETDEFDCLISDYQMPGMDGIQLAQIIRNKLDIPIILYTGQGSEEVAEKGFSVGINDYMRKEFDPSHYRVLAKHISNNVAKYRSEKALYERMQFLQAIYNITADAIIVTNSSDEVVFWNNAAVEIFGFSTEEVKNKKFVDLLVPETKKASYQESQDSYYSGKTTIKGDPFQTHLCKNNDIECEVEVAISEIQIEGLPHLLRFIKNISEKKKYEKRMDALREISSELVNADTVDTIARNVRDTVFELFGVNHGGFAVIEDKTLRFIDDRFDGTKLILDMNGKGITVRAARTGETQHVNDVREDDDYVPDSTDSYTLLTLSELDVPVLVNGKPIAVINVESNYPNAFSKNDKRLLETMAEYISIAMDRIYVLSDREDYRRKLEALHPSAAHLAGAQTEDELFELTVESIHRILGFPLVGIAIPVEKGFEYKKFLETNNNILSFIPGDIPSITSRAFKSGKTQDIPDIREDSDYLKGYQSEVDDPPRYLSELCVPILIGTKVVAILNMEHYSVDSYSDSDKHLIEILAMHFTTALERIWKTSEIQENDLRLRAITDNAADAIIVTDNKDSIVMWNPAAEYIFGYESENVIGKKLHDIIFPYNQDRYDIDHDQFLNINQKYRNKYTIEAYRKNGQEFPIELTVSTIVIREKPHILRIIRDNSENKNFRETLQALQQYSTELLNTETIMDVAIVTRGILAKVFKYTHGTFAVVSDDKLVYIGDTTWNRPNFELPLDGNGISVRAVKTGQVQFIPDLRLDPDWVFNPSEPKKHLSEIDIPVKVDSEVIALINVESPELNAFTSVDQQLLEIFAGYISSAIKRINATQEEKIFKDRLESLHQHVLDLDDTNTVEEVYNLTFGVLRKSLGYELIDIIDIVDGNLIRLPNILYSEARVITSVDGPGITARTARLKQTQLIQDIRKDPDYMKGLEDNMLSELAVPVVIEDKTRAIINLESAKPNAFTVQDQKLVETLAQHLSSKILKLKQEKEILESESRSRSLLESSRDGIIVIQNNKIVYGNKRFVEILEYDDINEVIGIDFLEILVPELRPQIEKNSEARLKGETVPDDYELKYIKKDGNIVDVDVRVSLFKFENKPAHMATVRDITIAKKQSGALISLHEHATKLATVTTLDEIVDITYRTIDDLLNVQRGSFAIVRGNNLCHEYNWQMGHNNQIIMPLDGPGITVRAANTGKSQLIDDVFDDPHYFDAVGRREEQVRSELAVPIKTGGRVSAVINLESTTLSDFDESDQRILEVFAEHVASAMVRIQHRDMVEEMQEKHVDELINGFRRVSSMVRHDMRNPLRTINIALDRMSKHPEETEKMMELVNRNIKYSNEIMEDWRQQTLQGDLKSTETNILEMINELVHAMHVPENISINVDVKEEIVFRLDTNKIKRVLGNLTKNAVEAMPQGGALSVSSKMIENDLEIIVSDTGTGISEKGLSKLFTPFNTTKPNGMGLGLPYCKQAVEAHKGTIKVKSKIGEGTHFIIRLPAVEKQKPVDLPQKPIVESVNPISKTS